MASESFSSRNLKSFLKGIVGGVGAACEEIFNFCQDDLCVDDVMLLDAYAEVFVWIGADANANEIDEARTLAAAYVAACVTRDGRDPECPVNEIQSGREPPAFTSNFIGWDHSVKNGVGFVDPYEAKLAAAKEKESEGATASFASPALKKVTPGTKAGPGSSSDKTFQMPKLRSTPAKAPESNSNGGNASPVPTSAPSAPSATPGVPSKASGVATGVDKPAGTVTFSKAELAAMDGSSGIDMERKESYLSAGEFVEVFGMERNVFDAMPLWKRQAAKKKAGLF